MELFKEQRERINDVLKTVQDLSTVDWEMEVDHLQLKLNNTVNTPIGETFHFLLHGCRSACHWRCWVMLDHQSHWQTIPLYSAWRHRLSCYTVNKTRSYVVVDVVSPLGIIIISDFCFCAFTVELFIFVVVSSLLYINRFELCFYCAFQIECCFVILFLYWYENCSESGFAKMCLFLGSFFFIWTFWYYFSTTWSSENFDLQCGGGGSPSWKVIYLQ